MTSYNEWAAALAADLAKARDAGMSALQRKALSAVGLSSTVVAFVAVELATPQTPFIHLATLFLVGAIVTCAQAVWVVRVASPSIDVLVKALEEDSSDDERFARVLRHLGLVGNKLAEQTNEKGRWVRLTLLFSVLAIAFSILSATINLNTQIEHPPQHQETEQ